MTKIQIITLETEGAKVKILIEQASETSYRAYFSVKFDKVYEPFVFAIEDIDRQNILIHSRNMIEEKFGRIIGADNQNSDIYATFDIALAFGLTEVSEEVSKMEIKYCDAIEKAKKINDTKEDSDGFVDKIRTAFIPILVFIGEHPFIATAMFVTVWATEYYIFGAPKFGPPKP